jgi:hypothetical protein
MQPIPGISNKKPRLMVDPVPGKKKPRLMVDPRGPLTRSGGGAPVGPTVMPVYKTY